MKRKVIVQVLKYAILPFLIILIVDYLNFPSMLKFKIQNINFDVFVSAFNAFIVIMLYVITFIIIDKREIDKDNNAKATAKILIITTYQKCLDIIDFINNQKWLEKYIVSKVDFNKTDSENPIVMNLRNDSFSAQSDILQLAENGAISKNDLQTYLEIMNLYKSYVSLRITFFDINLSNVDLESSTKETLILREKIMTDSNKLTLKLKKEIDTKQSELEVQ